MDELTLELFDLLAGSPELDEEGRQQLCTWVSALLQLRYLTDTEKKNALVLLDFAQSLSGGEVLAPLYRAARAKLSFVTPVTWDIDLPESYCVSVNGQELDVDGLRRHGIEHIDFHLTKPIRKSLEYSVIRRIHADRRVEILPEYQVYGGEPVGELHVFNTYGEKAVSR